MDRKKNLLYIHTVEEGRPFQGVRKKIQMQCQAFEDLGLDVKILESGKRTFFGQIEKIFPLSYGVNYKIIRNQLLKYETNSIDYCYIRYSPASRGLLDVLKLLKHTQECVKIIIEIPTYPYESEFKSIKAKPSKIRDHIYRRKMKKYVDLIVTPSNLDEMDVFGIPACEITNGINLNLIAPRACKNDSANVINLIGCALITPRQGYERVIKGIDCYNKIKKETDPEVRFFIIGSGEYQTELKKLCESLDLSKYVMFEGQKEGSALDYYYDIGSLGIGSLGTYKTNELKKVNSLKTREYCAKGLPFLITKCDHIFAKANPFFCHVVEEEENEISIQDVVSFVKKMYKYYSQEQVVTLMRDFASENLSWTTILKNVLEKVCEK